MDPRLKNLIEQLEKGEITPEDFQIRLKDILDEVGEEARQSVDGDHVKLERIDSAARKASAF